MPRALRLLFSLFAGSFRSRRDLLLENLALRQQLAVLARLNPQTRLAQSDRLFWLTLRRLWPRWWQTLVLVQAETLVGWHRAGFELYRKWLSCKHAVVGSKPTSKELREHTFRMAAENRTLGAPRIHGELRKPCFEISERTVLGWIQ
jgi:hypothetical protein